MGEEYVKAVYCHFAHLTYMQSTIWNARLDEAQAGINIAVKNINNTTLMAESKEELKSLLVKVKEEREIDGLKFIIQKLRSWYLVPSLRGKKKVKM